MIPFIRPEMPPMWSYIPDMFLAHVSGRFSNGGPALKRLESELAKYHMVHQDDVVCVANATLGLEIAIKSILGKGDGTKWIAVPAFTFPATVNAIVNSGYIPLYLDIHSDQDKGFEYLADFSDQKPHPEVIAFIPVAAFGRNIPNTYLEKASEIYNMIIVDAAPGILSNKQFTTVAQAWVFSMHATKSVPAGEGGYIVYNHGAGCYNARLLINFGLDGKAPKIAAEAGGTNAKMSEFNASVGLASIRRINKIANGKARFSPCKSGLNWHLRIIKVKSSVHAEKQMARLGVECRRYYRPLCVNGVPNSWKAYQTLLCLPWYSKLTKTENDRIMYAMEIVK